MMSIFGRVPAGVSILCAVAGCGRSAVELADLGEATTGGMSAVGGVGGTGGTSTPGGSSGASGIGASGGTRTEGGTGPTGGSSGNNGGSGGASSSGGNGGTAGKGGAAGTGGRPERHLSFRAGIDYASSSDGNQAIARGDFDGDDAPDFAVSNASGTITIFHNAGDGTFDSASEVTVQVSPGAIAAGDLNGDGLDDLAVVAGLTDQMAVLLNEGGSFGSHTVASTVGRSPNSLVIADLNGDQANDIAVLCGNGGSIDFYFGSGDGAFALERSAGVADHSASLVQGDLNDDGSIDLAFAVQSEPCVYTLLNSDGGYFRNGFCCETSAPPTVIAAADLDGDRRLDFAAAVQSANVDVCLNGALEAVTSSVGVEVLSVTAGNMDRHRATELVVGGYGPGVNVLENLRLGSFGGRVEYTASALPYAMIAEDLDGDGRTDLATVTDFGITVMKSDSNGLVAANRHEAADTGGAESVAVGDLDGDDWPDLVTVTQRPGDPGVKVLLGTRSGGFAPPVSYAVENPSDVALGDMNGDGALDLAVTDLYEESLKIFLNDGRGNFNAQMTRLVGYDPQAVALGDFDEDGFLDAVTTSSTTMNVRVLLGDGRGGFRAEGLVDCGAHQRDIEVGDVNGDGHLDFVTAGLLLGVFLGDGTSAFAQLGVGLDLADRVALGDLNDDGASDIVASKQQTTSGLDETVVEVLLSNGSGRFYLPMPYEVGRAPAAQAIGDLDLDDAPDLVVARSGGSAAVLLNDGHGFFARAPSYAAGAALRDVVIADMDRDARNDIVTANGTEASLAVLLNTTR